MTERKPPGVAWESFIDRQIRKGQERGDFDRLPGSGKPIADLDRPRDELWWVRRKLRDEQLGHLPPSLQIRRDREVALAAAMAAPSEHAVRRIVEDVNRRIIDVNRMAITGPPSTTMPLDLDEVLARWRDARQGGAGGPDRQTA